jgi:hypothetical protein
MARIASQITDEWRRTHLYVYSDFRTSALSLNRCQQGSALTNKAHGVHPQGYSLVDRLTALYPISGLMQLIARIRFGREARFAEPRTASFVTQAKIGCQSSARYLQSRGGSLGISTLPA